MIDTLLSNEAVKDKQNEHPPGCGKGFEKWR
jgi:hypothetical protein